MRDRRIGVVLVAMIVAGTAHAQPSPADQAFERGREALKIGKYAEACAAFAESQKLDPRWTTLFNMALCEEQLGRLASALAIHKELAVNDDNAPRKSKAADTIAELEARVPRLRIEIAQDRRASVTPTGLEVTINGVRVTNFRDQPVDLGTSKVSATAPGYIAWSGEVVAKDEKQRLAVTITLDRDPAATTLPDRSSDPTPPSPPRVEPRTTSGSARKTLGIVGIAGGGLAIAGGFTFGILARSKWNQAKNVCGGTVCDDPMDLDRGQELADAARTRGTVSTALVIAGGVLVAGGVVLWVTAPKAERSVALAPSASGSAVALSMFGRF